MKKYFIIIICSLFFDVANGSAVAILYPENNNRLHSNNISFVFDPTKINAANVKPIPHRKLRLKERVALKILQWKLRKAARIKDKDSNSDKGKTALTFGIIALVSPLVPYLGGFSFMVFTLLALVYGYQAKKENPKNRKAKKAITLGWIAVGLFLGVLAILISMYSL